VRVEKEIRESSKDREKGRKENKKIAEREKDIVN
jgi:hypothetical protein